MDATRLAAPIHAGPVGGDSAKDVTMDGWMGKLVILLGTLGLVVGFVLTVFFLVRGPMVKMTWRR
jgi:hypothetical protein